MNGLIDQMWAKVIQHAAAREVLLTPAIFNDGVVAIKAGFIFNDCAQFVVSDEVFEG